MSQKWISIAAGVAFSALAVANLPQVHAESGASAPILAAAIEANAGGQYFTPVRINNNEIDTMVDTGASVVALTWDDAEAIRINPRSLKFTIPMSTANGMVNAAPIMLEKVDVDGVVVSQVQAVVMPEGALSISLLGMSYLSRVETFHVENGVMSFNE